jgi:hypothetical protein
MNKFISRKLKILGLVCLTTSLLSIQGCEKTKEPEHKPRLSHTEPPLSVKVQEIPLKGIFVDAASTASSPDGKSWESAFKTIAEAIAASRGEQIIIAAGTYKSPKIRIIDKKNIKLVGGYHKGDSVEKTLTNLEAKDLVILDGNGQLDSLITIKGASGNITLLGGMLFRNVVGGHAVAIIGTASKPIKDINIFNCKFEDNRFADGSGAGLKIEYARTLYLTNVSAQKNLAESGGFAHLSNSQEIHVNGGEWLDNKALRGASATEARGGAFYGENIKVMSLKPAVVRRGEAEFGGGIYLKNVSDSTVAELKFESNSTANAAAASDGGAGLYIEQSKDIAIHNVVLTNNKTRRLLGSNGGAIKLREIDGLTVDFVKAEIANNIANAGGALSIENSKKIKVSGGHFLKNIADNVGGAIFVSESSDVVVEKGIFEGNKSQNFGGALCFSKGRKGLVLKDLKLSDSLTTVAHGGALAVVDQQDNLPIILDHLSFVGNKAAGNGGAAIFKGIRGKVIIERSKFENNSAQSFGGALALDGKSFNTAQFVIEPETKFLKNESSKNAGGGALFATFNNVAPPEVQLVIKNRLQDYGQNKAGDGTLGTFLRVTSHAVTDSPAGTAPAERGANPAIFGPLPLLEITSFISDTAGHNLAEGQTVYLW